MPPRPLLDALAVFEAEDERGCFVAGLRQRDRVGRVACGGEAGAKNVSGEHVFVVVDRDASDRARARRTGAAARVFVSFFPVSRWRAGEQRAAALSHIAPAFGKGRVLHLDAKLSPERRAEVEHACAFSGADHGATDAVIALAVGCLNHVLIVEGVAKAGVIAGGLPVHVREDHPGAAAASLRREHKPENHPRRAERFHRSRV